MRLALLIREGLVFKGKVLIQNMSHFKTVNEQARHNELQRLEVREKELFLQQQELQRYRNELQAQDSDEENTWKQEEQVDELSSDDEAEQAADRAEQAAEEERKRAYLMELAKSKHKKKTSGKFTMYR